MTRSRRYFTIDMIIPGIAHVGSITGITSLYFMRSGSFKLDYTNWMDISMAVLILLCGSAGVILFRSKNPNEEIKIKRKELNSFLYEARNSADYTIDIIAGDISWIHEEEKQLLELLSARPELTITVFYEKDKISNSNNLLLKMNELESAGIKLNPYKDRYHSKIRCTVIDRDHHESMQLFVYKKINKDIAIAREEHLFLWQEKFNQQDPIIKIIRSYVSLLLSQKPAPIHIGISGLNNVGKTTLINNIIQKLKGKYNTSVIQDKFRSHGNKTDNDENIKIIIEHLDNKFEKNIDIYIHDRTVIDDYCFYKSRKQIRPAKFSTTKGIQKTSTNKEDELLESIVVNISSIYDLIFFVSLKNQAFTATSCMTKFQRQLTNKELLNFYKNNNIKTEHITNDYLNSDKIVNAIVNIIENKFREIRAM